MKKTDIKKIENLINEEGIRGKALLKEFPWINTTKPKFTKGDIVLFSDTSRKLYGITVKDFVGVINKARYHYLYDKPFLSYITYEITFIFNNEEFKAYVKEANIKKTQKKANNQTPKNDTKDCFFL